MFFVYNKFKLRKWRKYSPQKRLQVLQALEDKMAKKQHRDPIPVVVYERYDWQNFGMFSVINGKKRIYVHDNLVSDPTYRFHALETIIHEGRHATQYVKIKRDKIPWWDFEAKRWKKNFGAYFSASEDRVMYNNQEVERDAQRYTINMLKKLEYKYRHEDHFYTTLDRNIYRYENAETEARKKYGMFYRHKIRKQVDKKYQDRY